MRIIDCKLFDKFSAPNIFKKFKNVDHKGYVHNKSKKKMNADFSLVEQMYECFKFKRLKNWKLGKSYPWQELRNQENLRKLRKQKNGTWFRVLNLQTKYDQPKLKLKSEKHYTYSTNTIQ